MRRPYEIRDPIHGFVRLNDLERDVVNHPAFQRLRRIRQLAWTDMVYPGAMHTRFEHSLGVMHVATRLFRTVCDRNQKLLQDEYGFSAGSMERQEQIIRLAALLHDVGHTPFSHSGEELLPIDEASGEPYSHEAYSAAILRYELADAIEDNRQAETLGIRVSDIGFVFGDGAVSPSALVWKALLSGQMDADRMDYLLRDSHHAGVAYGRYDLDRLASTVEFCRVPETDGHELGVGDDGVHAVEALLIARYLMFTQVYFHKTRAIYDYHLVEAMKEILAPDGGRFPPPTIDGIKAFLEWDDWRVLGAISAGLGGKHGAILRDRRHYRCVYWTSETATDDDVARVEAMKEALLASDPVIVPAEKSWYQPKKDILVAVRHGSERTQAEPLSIRSPIVNGMRPINQRRLYVPEGYRDLASTIIDKITGGSR